MALAVLIPLPFDIVSTILRFWIRYKRKAWGPDDWAMLINLPFWSVSTIATIAMAWSGVGQYDGSLSEYQYSNSLMEELTALSYAVAVVSISTDWIFATLPIFLLWDVQLDWRVKSSVIAMLGLGVFASIAPIVRLKFLIGLNDPNRLLQNLGEILAWACAEMNVGMFVANLPACRPILTNLISHFSSSFRSRSGPSHNYGSSKKPYARGSLRGGDPASKHWMELDERPESTGLNNHLGNKSKDVGVETKIYGDLDEISNISSERDDGSQKRIVNKRPSGDGIQVNVQKDFKVEITSGKQLPPLPRLPSEPV
ncbi:unnamed protein product [Alternaria alternata]